MSIARLARLARLALVATIAVASAGTTTAFAQAKDAARDKRIADFAAAFAAAFNKGDAKGVAAMYSVNAIRVGQDTKEIGRAAIEKALTVQLAGPFKGAKMTIAIGTVQALSADVEVAEGTYTLTGMKGPDGKPLPAVTASFLNTHVIKGGAMLLSSNAAIPPAPPTPAAAKK